MKTTEILTRINAFMGQMREGDTRKIIANLQAALDYQTEKLRIYEEKYKAETGKERPELTDDERRRLARRGRAMNQYLLSITENTWAPSTVMGWYSKLIADKYNSTGPNQKTRGRKPITDELKKLILRLAEQNPSWGYKRIRDYAVYLGYEVSFMTVKRIMNKYGYFPPTDGRTNSDWEMFFNAHQNVITACDFATYELVTPLMDCSVSIYCFLKIYLPARSGWEALSMIPTETGWRRLPEINVICGMGSCWARSLSFMTAIRCSVQDSKISFIPSVAKPKPFLRDHLSVTATWNPL